MTLPLADTVPRIFPAVRNTDVAAVLLALRWAVRADAILAPAANGGVSVAVAAEPPPEDVRLALEQSWRAVRLALDTAGEQFAQVDAPTSPAILTCLAWTRAERAAWWFAGNAGDERARDRLMTFEERAAVRDYDAGTPRWLAEALAVEELLCEPNVNSTEAWCQPRRRHGGDDEPS